jgi:peptide/nickel transport system substrate-binding protein
VGFPNLQPFYLVRATQTVTEFERNPYYYKVDAAGNQLPYIDRVVNRVVQDTESTTIEVISGNIDFMREDTALNEMPLYRENEDKGGYIAHSLGMHVDPTCIFINQTYDDPVWREVVRNVQFRRALNMAIDREEINDAIYFNFGSMPELVPSEFNPSKAEQMLDEMGMTKGPDGFRVGPDGNVFEIPFEVASHAVDIIPVTELVMEMWNSIGVKTTMKTLDAALHGERNAANELRANVIWNVQPMWRSGGWLDFMPNQEARLWRRWYDSDGTEGEEPPAYVKRLYELGELIMTVYPGTPEDQEYFEEIYGIHHDYVLQMPIVEKVQQPLIVNADMGNVPVGGTAVAVDIGGEQLFYRNPE